MSENSFNGTWKLNLSASSLPFAAPRSVTLEIIVQGDEVSLQEKSVDAQGFAETVAIRAKFDNSIYPVVGSSLADGLAIERLDERTWRTRGTKKAKPVFTAMLTLAADGSSLREVAETTLADGTRAPAILVYERQ